MIKVSRCSRGLVVGLSLAVSCGGGDDEAPNADAAPSSDTGVSSQLPDGAHEAGAGGGGGITGGGGSSSAGSAAGGSVLPGKDAAAEVGLPDGGLDAASDAPSGRDLSTDSAKFLGASRCAAAGLKLCEDFEEDKPDVGAAAKWLSLSGGGKIESGNKARGSKAFHITGTNSSFLKASLSWAMAKNTYYGRMFVWFDKLPNQSKADPFSHWTMATGNGDSKDGEIRVGGFLQKDGVWWGVGTDGGPSGDWEWLIKDRIPAGMPKAKTVPEKQWQCVEWLQDGDKNETSFWLDGVDQPQLHTTATSHGQDGAHPNQMYLMPKFKTAQVGWVAYQSADVDVWIDEVGLDTDRIGCNL